MFKIVKFQSTVCEKLLCDQRIDKSTDEYVLSLNVGDIVDTQNVNNILGQAYSIEEI